MDGFVLAGGASLRMGVDKARLPFPGRWPMAVHVLSVVAEVCDRAALVRRGDDGLPWPEGVEVLREPEREPHPLHGVATACAASRSELLLVVPCDVPFLPAEGLRRLLPGPAVASDGTRDHPLVAILPRALGPAAAEAAAAGRSVHDLLRDLPRVVLPAPWLRNANAPGDLPGVDVLGALLAALPPLPAGVRERVLAAEVRRLRERGAVPLRSGPPAGR